MKGRACFERARQRENLTQSQRCLSGKPHPKAIVDAAVPGVPYVPPAGDGQGQPMVPQNARGIVDAGNWPNAPTRPGEMSVTITQEHREANGPCWFYNIGACVRENCNKAHRVVAVEKKKSIPITWVDGNLPENEGLGKGGKDGYQTDQSQTGTSDSGKGPKRWDKRPYSGTKGDGKTAGEGSQPCRFIQEGETRPRAVNCYSFWSHPLTESAGVDFAALVKQSASSGASASDSGAIPWTGVKPTNKN
jgi:hypothetical protein